MADAGGLLNATLVADGNATANGTITEEMLQDQAARGALMFYIVLVRQESVLRKHTSSAERVHALRNKSGGGAAGSGARRGFGRKGECRRGIREGRNVGMRLREEGGQELELRRCIGERRLLDGVAVVLWTEVARSGVDWRACARSARSLSIESLFRGMEGTARGKLRGLRRARSFSPLLGSSFPPVGFGVLTSSIVSFRFFFLRFSFRSWVVRAVCFGGARRTVVRTTW